MAQVTVQKLLEPISRENPCGEIISDNPDFYVLKDMLEGKEETQWSPYEPPDWKNILRLSKGLLLKGKDLWVVVIYVYASTQLYGLEGLQKGLEFLKDMMTLYWDDIQPELDAEDEDDFTLMRLNPLATMSSEHEHLCKMLKEMRFIETQRIGKFNYYDIKILADETAVRSKALENMEIEHIAADIRQERYDETVSFLNACIKIIKEIDSFITEKVGEVNNVSNLNKLIAFMNGMLKLFAKCTGTGEESAEELGQNSEEGETSAKSGNTVKIRKEYNEVNIGDGIVKTEQDVVRQLKYLIKWYEINHPMSPMPGILQRGVDIVGLKFEDMMKVLMKENNPGYKVKVSAGVNFEEEDGDSGEVTLNKGKPVKNNKSTAAVGNKTQKSTGTEELQGEKSEF